jgi:uncharacterized protein YaaQ
MKLMVCICQNKYVNEVVQTLNQNGYRSTKLASTGGFLKKGNTTLLIGINNEGKENVMKFIQEACEREDQRKTTSNKMDQKQGRITIFVVDANSGYPHT